MSVYHDRVTLGTAAVEIVPAFHNAQYVMLHNMTKSSNEYVYVGSSAVGTGNSIHIDPGENLAMHLPPGDALFAVSDPSGLDVGVLVMRK